MAKKSFTEKMLRPTEIEVVVADKTMMGIQAGTKMLISTPMEIRDYVRAIPKGKTGAVPQMRDELARKHGAEVTCPLTTGIFLRIVAEAALEEMANGVKAEAITPFWRMIGPKDKIAKKLACDPEWIAAQRSAEGIA